MPVYYNQSSKTFFFKFMLNYRQYLRRGYENKKVAKKAEKEFKQNLVKQYFFQPERQKITYKQALLSYEDYLKTCVKETTFRDIERAIKSYYLSYFDDNKYLYSLTMQDALKCRNLIDRENISPRTKNKKLNFLKRFFHWCLLNYNCYYQAFFTLTKFKDYRIKKTEITKRIIEISELKEILKRCQNDDYFTLAFLTLFIYGYRLSELLGLKVDSIDFKNHTIESYVAVNFKTGNGSYIEITPKTEQSDRINYMSDSFAKLIKKHIEKYELKHKDFIFFNYKKKRRNEPLHENTFRRIFESYSGGLSPHVMRRTLVTHLREKGVTLEEISNYIGHESLEVTEQYYLKKSREKEEKINLLVEKLINEAEEK